MKDYPHYPTPVCCLPHSVCGVSNSYNGQTGRRLKQQVNDFWCGLKNGDIQSGYVFKTGHAMDLSKSEALG